MCMSLASLDTQNRTSINLMEIYMKTWNSTITYSVIDIGRECGTEEEYKEWVKQSFREEHNIELEDRDITDIEYEESA